MTEAWANFTGALYQLPSNPIFQLGFIVWAICSLCFGTKQIIKADRESHERETAARLKAIIPLAKLIEDALNEGALRKIDEAREEFETALNSYHEAIEGFLLGGAQSYATHTGDPMSQSRAHVQLCYQKLLIYLHGKHSGVQLTNEKPNTTTSHGPVVGVQHKGLTQHLDPELNATYLAAHRADLAAFKEKRSEALRDIEARHRETTSARGTIEERMKSWVNEIEKDSTAS